MIYGFFLWSLWDVSPLRQGTSEFRALGFRGLEVQGLAFCRASGFSWLRVNWDNLDCYKSSSSKLLRSLKHGPKPRNPTFISTLALAQEPMRAEPSRSGKTTFDEL